MELYRNSIDTENKRQINLLGLEYTLLWKSLCNRLAFDMPLLERDFQNCAAEDHTSSRIYG